MKIKAELIENPKDSIILSPRKHDNYQAPDFLVGIHRLGIESELNLFNKNTCQELDNTPYIGNINHSQALSLNSSLGGFTLFPLELTDVIYRLMQGIGNNEIIYYSDKTPVPREILQYMLNEMIVVRAPWRGEWLDAEFDNNQITYHKFDSSGNIIQVTEHLDKDTLMENRSPGISLADYIKNPTSQGLPRKTVKEGEFHYWHPKNGRVARLLSDSVRVLLYCNWDSGDADSSLGVRRSQKIS